MRRFKPLSLAQALYLRVRKWEDAPAHYQRLQLLQMGGRWEWGATYVKSYYWSGRVLEELSRKDAAKKNYSQFLDLWKDTDPGLPEGDDAKKRLATLHP